MGGVIIVSASLGYGHHRIAASIKEEMEREGISAQVVDLLEESHTLQGIRELYLAMLEKTPSVYGNAYYWSRKAGSTTGLFYLFCRKSLERIRRRFQPAAYVFVHPFGAAAYRCSSGVPAYAVTTDLAFHSSWYNPEIRGYFVAREAIGNALVARGYPRDQVYITGIPLATAFYRGAISGIVRGAANRQKPYVLVMGGGLGLGAMAETVDVLEKLAIPLEGAILTGRNSQLRQALAEKLKSFSNQWQVLPFVDRVERLMGRADLLISKGGAVTLSEAAACGLPVVIHRPLPGHEEENAAVAAGEGWARHAGDKLALQQAVRMLLNEREKREAMSRQALQCSYPFATSRLVYILAESLKICAWRRSS